jgi:hypothetical protein
MGFLSVVKAPAAALTSRKRQAIYLCWYFWRFCFKSEGNSDSVGGMKRIIICLSCVLVATSAFCAARKSSNPKQAIGIGARDHVNHSVYEELPFDDGDITYTLGYEYHDMAGYWQILVGYTPDLEDKTVDYVITPQLNLIIQDRIFLAGTGVMGSYIESVEDGGDWTDVYWQFMLGLEIPLGPVKLEAMAYYPFDDWSDLNDFDFGDIEYGGSLKYYF